MKHPLLFIVLLFCSFSVTAQYQPVTEEQKKEITGKMSQTSNKTNTMQCDFTQVKELSFMDDKTISEGKMFYKKTDKIRWEYTNPYQYIFSMDGENVNMTLGDKTNTIPARQRKLFNGICKVMLSSISGTGLVDSPDFDTEFFVGSDDYKIVLLPKKKEEKDLFTSIQLYVNKSDGRVGTVEMVEKSGDKTTITLKNMQVNITLNDKIFLQ